MADKKIEKNKLHFRVIRFLTESALKLHMKSPTLATAAAVYHTFFRECETEDYDPYLIATTALYLAGKVEEDHMKLRDVINVCYRTLHTDQPGLEIGEKYWAMRDSVVQCELFVMRMLKFTVKFDHPHKYMLHYLKSVCDWMEPSISKRIPIAKFAWGILRDSYHGPICLKYRPEHIAIAVIYFTLQLYGMEVPFSDEAEYRWWEVLSEDATEDELKGISSDILDIYELESSLQT
ncbi:cyclin-Q-like [Lineus longissimus]|uniref:cyclin-Q-like n=1 Tax=Lineus longissimus TaxID=88925 RepID=UPI002B4C4C7A